VILSGEHNLLIGARRGSPLAIGYGDGEMFLGSDALALAPLTQRICYLDEGDWAAITANETRIFNADNQPVTRPIKLTELSGALIGKGNFRHFMEKEIFEQPASDRRQPALGVSTRRRARSPLQDLPFALEALSRVTIVACGTSFPAGLVARYWIEGLAKLPTTSISRPSFATAIAACPRTGSRSSSRSRARPRTPLAALRYAKSQGSMTAVLVNTPESSMAREADVVLHHPGRPRRSASPSTKAFTTQLTVLACFALALARARKSIDQAAEARLCQALAELPARVAEVLNHDQAIQDLALAMVDARDVLFLGRGSGYPISARGRAQAEGDLVHPCRRLWPPAR